MAGSNNFQVFNENFLNSQSDADYASESQRVNGLSNGIAKTAMHNKLFRQLSVMVAAIGQFIASQGNAANDADMTALSEAFANSVTPASHLNAADPHPQYASDADLSNIQGNLVGHLADTAPHGIGNRSTLLTTEKGTIVGAVNELFTNVSDGKQAIATAITGKGGTASGSDTFSQLASQINNIGTVVSVQKGVLSFDTFATTISTTISSVNVNNSIVLLNGNSSDSDSPAHSAWVVLTNSTTLTATRYWGNRATTINFVVIEFAKLKSKQTGTIIIPANNALKDVTISSVNTTNAVPILAGWTSEGQNTSWAYSPRIMLIDATTLKAVRIATTSYSTTLAYQIIEF